MGVLFLNAFQANEGDTWLRFDFNFGFYDRASRQRYGTWRSGSWYSSSDLQ
jgi:hypothetical protein